jgi:hypothetical protein
MFEGGAAMSLLEQHLGRVLTASDVSEYLRCDISTVYRHYRELGGFKIGASYKFFERSLIDALAAVKISQPAKSIAAPPPAERSAPRSKPRSLPSKGSFPSDRHGLL